MATVVGSPAAASPSQKGARVATATEGETVSLNRYAKRRDDNESQLVSLATAVGALMVEAPPLDYWCHYRGHWIPVEVKRPDKEGWKSEFTPKQVTFLMRCNERQAVHWVWRTEQDVYRDLNCRVTA